MSARSRGTPMPTAHPSPARKLGRRERHGAETREKIFRTALKLFAERGFQGTTVEDITEAADVGKGTFFNYFPTKEHLLEAFGELQRGKIDRALAAAQEGRQPLEKILREMVRALSEEPGRSPALARSILFAVLSREAVRETVSCKLELGRQRLAELFAMGQQRGEVRDDRRASELALVLQRAAFGTMVIWTLQPTRPLAEQMGMTFDLFWSGISAAAAASSRERGR